MATLYDRTGQPVDVPDDQVQEALLSGKFGVPKDMRIAVRSPQGEVGSVPFDQAVQAFESGYSYYGDAHRQADEERTKYEGLVPGLEATGAGVARGLTAGASDYALTRTGLAKPETLEKLKEHNPVQSIGGEVAGMIAPALLTGGGSAAAEAPGAIAEAKGLGSLVRGAAELAPSSLIGKAGEAAAGVTKDLLGVAPKGAGLLQKAVLATAPRMVGGATEMAAYGAGQELSDAVLGDKDITAEKLLAGAGLGAVAGGIGSGLFSIGGQFARAGLEKLPPIDLQKLMSDFAENRAVKAAGALGSDFRRLGASGKLNGLGRDLLDQGVVTLTSSFDDMATKAEEVRLREAGTIADLSARLDAKADPAVLGRALNPFSIADRFQADVVDPLAKFPTEKGVVEQLEKHVDSLRAMGDRPMTFTEAQQLRAGLEPQLAWGAAPAALQDSLKKLDEMVGTQLDKAAKAAGAEEELSALRSSQRVYDHMVSAKNLAEKALAKQGNRLFDPFGMALAVMAGPKGIAAAGMGYAKNAYGPQVLAVALDHLSQLHAVGRMADAVGDQLEAAIAESLTGKPGKYEAPAVKGVLDAVQFTDRSYPGPAKNALEAATRRARELGSLAGNPAQVQRLAEEKAGAIAHVAPPVGKSIADAAAKAVQFLATKAPKLPTTSPLSPGSTLTPAIAPGDLAKFARYVRTANDPLSALKDLRHGIVSDEAKETLQALHPKLYQLMRTRLLEELQKSDRPKVPYARRLAIARLFDVPADPTLAPPAIANLQRAHVTNAQQSPGGAPAGGRLPSSGLRAARLRQSSSDRIEER